MVPRTFFELTDTLTPTRTTHHGSNDIQHLLPALREEANEDSHGWIGRCRKDNDPVQAQAGWDCDDHPDYRFQCGDRWVKKHLLHRLGRGWPGQNPTFGDTTSKTQRVSSSSLTRMIKRESEKRKKNYRKWWFNCQLLRELNAFTTALFFITGKD